MTSGTIELQRPPAHYEINDEQLRRDLLDLAKSGTLTEDEVNDAVPAIVQYKANNSKLNYIARHRGVAAQEAIDRNRRKVAGEGAGKVIWPK